MNGPKRDALTCEALDYIDELDARNHLLVAGALQPVHTAVSVRVRNGRFSSTDGPFAETKEQLGGFVLIDAIDLNEALQIVAKNPMARFGTIEVRPIMPLERRARPVSRWRLDGGLRPERAIPVHSLPQPLLE